MKEKKFNFVYITTNLINQKQYVGDHSTDNLESSYSKKYLGSGHPYFSNAISKYGRENFKREILEFFDTKKEAFDAQSKYIHQFNTLNPNGYNLSPSGGIGDGHIMSEDSKLKIAISMKGKNVGKIHSDEHKKLNSISHIGKTSSEETKQKIKLALTNKPKSEEHRKHLCGKYTTQRRTSEQILVHNKNISGENHPYFGQHLSENHRANIGKGNKGKVRTEETKQKLRDAHLGKSMSEKTKNKIRESNLGKHSKHISTL
jgi:hypothetical protein